MSDQDRLERLITALLLQSMKDSSQREKILQLTLAGLTTVEIADLLGTTPANVAQSRYESAKSKSRRTRKSKSSKVRKTK